MDVRCENCQTVYEFDDARVKEGGVTVKCTQCGHIFKVRRRSTQRGPRTLPGMPPVPDGTAAPDEAPAGPPPPVLPETSHSTGRFVETGVDRLWMLRSATSGEVRRFRDLTTLQQWIVELKVDRDDEISRTGDRWKRIGSIAELEPFFRIVDAALSRGTAPMPPPARASRVMEAIASSNTPAPLRQDTPPMSPAWATGEPETTEPFHRAAGDDAVAPRAPDWSTGDGATEDEIDLPRSGPSTVMVAAVVALLLVGGAVGWMGVYRRASLRALFTVGDAPRGAEALRKGREYFLLDTDDDFRHADQQFQQAQGADGATPKPIASLVELNTTWARHLREEARLDEPSSPQHADELRARARTHVEEAHRYASEARSLGADDPDVNRALADLLVLDGAPAAQVEDALRRAEAARGDDPEVRYVRGVLRLRDGQLADAERLLGEANRLNQQQTQHDLLRADYALALALAQAGRLDEATLAARRILESNPRHVRAAALVARLEAMPRGGTDGGLEAALVDAGAPAAGPTTPPPAAVTDPAQRDGRADLRGYAALVAAGNRMLEHGKARDAVRMFEKALAERPGGVEAATGLAWSLLDTEHYNAAADKFREVLTENPLDGDAIIGLAETYKLRGDRQNALVYFKRYLADLPTGPKAAMAGLNVHELEALMVRDAAAAARRTAEAAEPAPPPAPSTAPNEAPAPSAPPTAP